MTSNLNNPNKCLLNKQLEYFIIQERNIRETWNNKWDWLVEEHRLLKSELKVIEKPVKESTDMRCMKPFPDTTNHMYGWLSSKSEFCLENLGNDVPQKPPLPDIYKLNTKLTFK